MKITAAIVKEKDDDIKFEEVELDDPQENEVLVEVKATGICHTEFGIQHQHIATPMPIALGHEGAGVIKKVGANVKEFSPGDHVVITFASCGECRCCTKGYPNSCESFGALNFGGNMLDGSRRLSKQGNSVANLFGQSSLASYCVAHKNNVVKVEEDVDFHLLAPLACGIQTGVGTIVNKLNPEPDACVAVFGCGSVGLSAIMGAAILGCNKIIAIDVSPERLELAKEFGATHAVNGKEQEVTEVIIELTAGGVDYAVESSGISAVVVQAIQSLRARGKLAIVGVSGDTTINIHDDLIPPNRTIMGVTQGDSNPKVFIPKLIEFYKEGKLPLDKMIVQYSHTRLDDALDDMRSGKTIKPVIVFH